MHWPTKSSQRDHATESQLLIRLLRSLLEKNCKLLYYPKICLALTSFFLSATYMACFLSHLFSFCLLFGKGRDLETLVSY